MFDPLINPVADWGIPGVDTQTRAEEKASRHLDLDSDLDPLVAIQMIDEILDALPSDIGAAAPDALTTLGHYVHATSRLHAATAQLSGQAEADGMWALVGARSLAGFMAARFPLTATQAKNYCSVGRQMRDHLPETARAIRSGDLGWEAGRLMAQFATTSPTRLAALDDVLPMADSGTDQPGENGNDAQPEETRCETWLVNQGRQLTVSQFRRVVRHWAAIVDPDADERGYAKVASARHAVLARTLDCYHLEAKLTPEAGKTIETAMNLLIGKPNKDDVRTGGQRRADALEAMARIVLDQNFDTSRVAARPHILLATPWSTFAALARHAGAPAEQLQAIADATPASWGDDAGPVPHSLLATMACDSQITRVIFGPDNQIINLGRTERVISPALRAAIVARDRHCSYPRCDAPPIMCDAHHLYRWTDGGKTDIDNLALLCRRHHRHIHTQGITIRPAAGATANSARAGSTGSKTGTASTANSASAPADPPSLAPGAAAIASVRNTVLAARPGYVLTDRHGHRIE